MRMDNKHPNSKAYNWLIYKHYNELLRYSSTYFKGVLYDLGCGTMPYKSFISKHVDKYVGVDWAESHHDISPDIIADLNQELEIEKGVADTIVSFSVLEHLREPQLFLRESNKIMKVGGHLILQVPFQWKLHEIPHDYLRYSPYALQYYLESAGFELIELKTIGGFFSTLFLKLNYFLRRFYRGPKMVKIIHHILAWPFYQINQTLALIMDPLDRDKKLEATGYWVICKKVRELKSV